MISAWLLLPAFYVGLAIGATFATLIAIGTFSWNRSWAYEALQVMARDFNALRDAYNAEKGERILAQNEAATWRMQAYDHGYHP